MQNEQFRGTELAKKVSLRTHPIYSIRPKTMFGSISEHVATLLHVIQCQTFVSRQNAQFWGTERPKKVCLRMQPIYSIKSKQCLHVIRSIPQHFYTKIGAKLVLSCRMYIFRVPNLRKKVSLRTHPFYSIRPKTMFGIVSKHVATLLREIQCKNCVSGQNAQFRGTKLPKKFRYECIQSTSLDPKWCLGLKWSSRNTSARKSV